MDAPELVSPSAHQMPDIIPLAPSVATAEHPVATPPAPAPAAPTKSTLRARVQMSPQASAALSRARAGAGKAHEFVGSFGTRAAQLRRHPAAARVEAIAAEHTARAREVLGRSEALRSAEAATGIDRIPLVLGAAALFTMLVPFDTFGLALPVATALALVGPAYYAVQILENGDAAAVKNILIYFVVLGFVQTFESLMAGALQRNIPRYHVFKLIVLAYLAHTKTKGAEKLHGLILNRQKRSTPVSPTKPADYPIVQPEAQTAPLAPNANGLNSQI